MVPDVRINKVKKVKACFSDWQPSFEHVSQYRMFEVVKVEETELKTHMRIIMIFHSSYTDNFSLRNAINHNDSKID